MYLNSNVKTRDRMRDDIIKASEQSDTLFMAKKMIKDETKDS